MIRILLALLASLGVVALVAASQRLGPALGRFWRAVLMVSASMLALVGVAVTIAGLEYEAVWAAISGGILLLLAARMGWSARKPVELRRGGTSARIGVPSTAEPVDPRWRYFLKQLSAAERDRAGRAQSAINGFLAERNSPALTPDHQSLLLSLEKRVPELLESCVERCRRARPAERSHYVGATLERLEQIGAEAERARMAVREADDRRLDTLHRYFDDVTSPKALPDRR